MAGGSGCIYLVAPDAGFFGNKIVKSVLNFGIGWNEQQQIPHSQSDPGGFRENRETGVKHICRFRRGCKLAMEPSAHLHSSRLASW